MTNRILIRSVVEGIAKNAFPKSKVISGTPAQVAKVELKRDEVLIAIYSDFRSTRDEIESSVETFQGWGFFIGLLDNLDNSPEAYENALATAEILGEQILKDLEASGNDLGFNLKSIIKTPNGKRTGESTTGLWFEATIIFSACHANIFPDLSEYMGQLSQRISPYDWAGIEQNPNAIELR